jgi:hypothetical protein
MDAADEPFIDFKAAAQATFTKLQRAFAGDDNCWQLGHSFDTVMDYFATVSMVEAAAFGKIALERYGATYGPWWDDRAWWGIAGLKASAHKEWFGEQVADFRQIAADCWKAMDGNAPFVWERRPKPDGKDYFGSLEPRFTPGGVWNSNWTPNLNNCESEPQPCDPIKSCDGWLCGFQNTVTNALYLVFATRLFLAYREPPYGVAANTEYAFLKEWFDVTPAGDALLNFLPSGGAVVRERVSSYRSGQPVMGYQQNMAWAGDQGIVVGGLVDRMLMFGKNSPEYSGLLSKAEKIAAGTKTYLAPNEILNPWTPGESAPGDDDDDYRTGNAVYMRYLRYAYQNNDDLRAYFRSERSGYPDFILANAKYVLANPSTADDMVGLTNDLATLVAAICMLA